ncbi:glycosyltransferase [Flavobacterium sp. H122]|uniref:glycosyltransferase n=1 Tax=Flavobacterium sp. H122 TaxID=2529860 RepID=UPI0010AA5FAA|nr:glycosyltransferase [Flavobacterium sp. H122]
MKTKKNILVAPLNWGLGHAARCIPIINALSENGFNPVIASDGVALELLKKEFPALTFIELPSYKIEYPKKGRYFKLKLVLNGHKIIKAILLEKSKTKQIIKNYKIEGIISDNRLGVQNKKVPSVFITHQLKVLTGNTTWLSTKMHEKIINKFNECWVPDVDGAINLSGVLGHPKKTPKNTKYIGPLSRLRKKDIPLKYDLMVILSGPEPQRTLLEEKLIGELTDYEGKIIFIKGKIEEKQTITNQNQFTFYNFMNSDELEIAFNESKAILCRSGYTTVMDLAFLGKKAFFIPTPGQYEQEYLAKKFKEEGIAPKSKQETFTLNKLLKLDVYKGFLNFEQNIDWTELFNIFNKKTDS